MGRKTVERGITYDDEQKCYYALLSTGTDANGKSTKCYKKVKSIKEGRALRKAHKQQMAQGRVLPPNGDTLAERCEQYVQYKSMQLQATTIYGYNNIIKNHIKPYFKKKKIQDIKVTDLRAYVVSKSKAGLSNTTIRRHLDLLNSIFDAAKKERIIAENPLDFMDKIASNTKKKEFYTPEETATLLNSLKDSQIKVAVYLAVCLGLRRGEVLGLRWSDIDFEQRVVHITNTVTQAGNKIIEKSPKTESGDRKLALVQPLYDVLLEEKSRVPTKSSMAEKSAHSKYVVSMRSGKIMKPNYLSDLFGKHIRKHNLKKIAFHDLRHTYATIAAHEGASIQEVSTSLGHSGIGVTASVYTHRFDEVKRVASEKVAASFSDLLEN